MVFYIFVHGISMSLVHKPIYRKHIQSRHIFNLHKNGYFWFFNMGLFIVGVSNFYSHLIVFWGNRTFIKSIKKTIKNMVIKSKTKKQFVDFVKVECKKYGIKCDLRPVKYLKLSGNIRCSGYFDETNKVLACATNSKDWFYILVHEYAHLTQWVDNCKAWKLVSDNYSIDFVDRWLNGHYVRNPEKHINLVRDLELDNEKRSVKLIKKFGLGDHKKYIKSANAYLMFYNYMKETRKWSNPKNSPYRNKIITSVMSDGFRMNYDRMSKRVREAFQKADVCN